VHWRSLLTEAAVLVNVPATQSEPTGVHGSPLKASDQFTPATHGAHWRLVVPEPATDCPWPTGHVRHSSHESDNAEPALSDALNLPPGQPVHTRSLLLVAAVLVNVPATQFELVTVHASPLTLFDQPAPATHVAHWRSAEAEPGTSCPWPIGHKEYAMHEAPLAYSPASHPPHLRSLFAVGAALSTVPAAQASLTTWHASPLFVAEYVTPASQSTHVRSVMVEPLLSCP
jgi:hypothetical protein